MVIAPQGLKIRITVVGDLRVAEDSLPKTLLYTNCITQFSLCSYFGSFDSCCNLASAMKPEGPERRQTDERSMATERERKRNRRRTDVERADPDMDRGLRAEPFQTGVSLVL